jgi:ubiquinone/menaquinone biosynthesis C-methylase UbiE
MSTTMLRKILPRRLKALIRETIRREVENKLVAPGPALDALRREIESGLNAKGYVEAIWPNQPGSHSYMILKHAERSAENCLFHESSPLPVPPKDLWLGYGDTVESFLAQGETHVGVMRRLIEETGSSIRSAGRIMEWGCAAGRMIRWLHDVTDTCEVWGTDICSHWITWCKQHLSPPFHFATTTTSPHLPFEDRYFGLIYAGSVFTHIDDLADAWFLELRRVLRPGGRLYITVHDQTTIEKAKSWGDEFWLRGFLDSDPNYARYSRSDFGMFTIGRSMKSQVFYDVDYLCRTLEPFFKKLAVSVGAYVHQTGVLFERV